MEKAKWLLSTILGLILSFTNKYGILIIFVAIAIVFDFVTGLIKAISMELYQVTLVEKDSLRRWHYLYACSLDSSLIS